MSIADRLKSVKQSIPSGVELVAVSKFHPASALMEAYDVGQRCFGESRAAELAEKAAMLPDDIVWHFIGHLQTNKVRRVVGCAHMIQSIDSERLLMAVEAEAVRQEKHIDVLLQLHVAAEETKFGLTPDEAYDLAVRVAPSLTHVAVRGVMGMASNTPDDLGRVAADFAAVRDTFDRLAAGPFVGDSRFAVCSMGMSDDRHMAIAAGSTMVRVGSDIFGQREY